MTANTHPKSGKSKMNLLNVIINMNTDTLWISLIVLPYAMNVPLCPNHMWIKHFKKQFPPGYQKRDDRMQSSNYHFINTEYTYTCLLPSPTTYLDETRVKFSLAHKSQMVNSGNSLESTDPHWTGGTKDIFDSLNPRLTVWGPGCSFGSVHLISSLPDWARSLLLTGLDTGPACPRPQTDCSPWKSKHRLCLAVQQAKGEGVLGGGSEREGWEKWSFR